MKERMSVVVGKKRQGIPLHLLIEKRRLKKELKTPAAKRAAAEMSRRLEIIRQDGNNNRFLK